MNDDLAARLGTALQEPPGDTTLDLPAVHSRARTLRRARNARWGGCVAVVVAGLLVAGVELPGGHMATLRQQPAGQPTATLPTPCTAADLTLTGGNVNTFSNVDTYVASGVYTTRRTCALTAPAELSVTFSGESPPTTRSLTHRAAPVVVAPGDLFTIDVTASSACITREAPSGRAVTHSAAVFVLADGTHLQGPSEDVGLGFTTCALTSAVPVVNDPGRQILVEGSPPAAVPSGDALASSQVATSPSTPVVTPCGTGDLVVQSSSVEAYAEVTTLHIDYLATRACSDSAPWKLEVRTATGTSDAVLTQTTEVRRTAANMLETYEISVPTTCRAAHLADPGTAAVYTESGARIDLPATLHAAGLIACHPTGTPGADAAATTHPPMAAVPPTAPAGSTDPAETDAVPGIVTTTTGSLDGDDHPDRVVLDGTTLTATFGDGQAQASGSAPAGARIAGISDLFGTGQGLILLATGAPCGHYRCDPATFDVYQVRGTAIGPLLLDDGTPLTLRAYTAGIDSSGAFRCSGGSVRLSELSDEADSDSGSLGTEYRLGSDDRVQQLQPPGPGPTQGTHEDLAAYEQVNCPGLDTEGYAKAP